MRDDERRTNEQTLKIELLSQWKLEAEFRKFDLVGFLLVHMKGDHVGSILSSDLVCQYQLSARPPRL